MSEVAELLKSIAKEIGKDEKVVSPFIAILDDNFYDTLDSIKDLKAEDYEKWKFPKRIIDLILQKLSNNQGIIQQSQQQVIQPQQQQQQQQIQQSNNFEEQKQQSSNQMMTEPTIHEKLLEKLNDIKENISTTDRYIEVLNFLKKIIQNIAENPSEQKFRKIKQSNKMFQNYFLSNRYALEFMYLNNFKLDEENLYLADDSLNLDLLNYSLNYLSDAITQATPSNFNPYQTYTSGNEVLCSRNLAQREGFVNYYDELQKLKAKREKLMSQTVSDRKLRVFKQASNQNQRSTQMEIEETMEENEKELLREFQSELKRMIQNLDKQVFSSKSKQEYEKLLKDPIYTKCLIRIKFPQNVILEGYFSPMETVKNVIDFVALNLESPELPFYIFQSPPRQIMDKRFYTKTLEEMGCLPGANFYFAIDTDPDFQKKFYLKPEYASCL